jgi:murein DD-endopeptidase MepM/ murein hydrolase activator NlpD
VVGAVTAAGLVATACAPAPRPVTSPRPTGGDRVVLPSTPPATGPVADARLYDATQGTVTDDDLAALAARALAVPVQGMYPDQVPDHFAAGRSGGRRHNAVDLFVPRGTPVLSADAGVVTRVATNALGGKTVWAADPTGRFAYYYAHLDGWTPGLAAGRRLERGDVLGWVGTTGNAPATAPHLHFQLLRITDPTRPWQGVPIDPRPFFHLPGTLR